MVKHGKKVVYGPEEAVFKDALSILYAANGEKIESWSHHGFYARLMPMALALCNPVLQIPSFPTLRLAV